MVPATPAPGGRARRLDCPVCRAMPVKDSLIAASALQHRLTVATRNTADFQHAGVPLVDPFAA